jgi:hypothetical protein
LQILGCGLEEIVDLLIVDFHVAEADFVFLGVEFGAELFESVFDDAILVELG